MHHVVGAPSRVRNGCRAALKRAQLCRGAGPVSVGSVAWEQPRRDHQSIAPKIVKTQPDASAREPATGQSSQTVPKEQRKQTENRAGNGGKLEDQLHKLICPSPSGVWGVLVNFCFAFPSQLIFRPVAQGPVAVNHGAQSKVQASVIHRRG